MFLLVKMFLIIYVLNTGKQPKLRNCFYGKTFAVYKIQLFSYKNKLAIHSCWPVIDLYQKEFFSSLVLLIVHTYITVSKANKKVNSNESERSRSVY